MKDLELWKFIGARLRAKKAVSLLIVAEGLGSSPGRAGFKMAVSEREICGSIGGGVMEVALVSKAFEQSRASNANSEIVAQMPEIVEQIHRKNVPNSSGMICSGSQTIICKQLINDDLALIEEIIRGLESKQTIILEITQNSFRVCNSLTGDAPFAFKRETEASFIYREKLGLRNNIYIIGGGHCALALSEIMSKLDFYIAVFDDRPNLNTIGKNEFAHSIHVIESYEKIGNFIDSGERSYVVVMTLGYRFDEIVIRQLIDKKFKYFGVLGSKAKMGILLKSLEDEGVALSKLNGIHTPIGLQINSHTPEEIAVSIAAEIIQVKNSGQ